MANKKKFLKVLAITGIVLGSMVLAAGAFVGVTTIKQATRKNNDPATVTEKHDYVTAVGSSLYDSKGNRLQLKGTNVGQALVYEGWLSPFSVGASYDDKGNIVTDADGNAQYPEMTNEQARKGYLSNPNLTDEQRDELKQVYLKNWFAEEDFRICKEELKFNCLRLPFYWRNILNDDYSLIEESKAFSYFDWFLSMCSKYQIYCVLDLHGAPGGQNGYEHCGTSDNNLWTNETDIQATCDLWNYIATHYSKHADLGKWIASFDILNEPCGTTQGKTTSVCYPVFDRIYQSIRKIDSYHNITIEGCWDKSAFVNPKDYGWTNIQYEFHQYNWNNVPYWLFYDYYELKSWFKNYDVPYYIGEFTLFEDSSQWSKTLDMYEKQGIGWTTWTYKKTVTGWWNDSWGIVNLKLNLNAETHETKVDLSKDSYDKIKEVFEHVSTEFCERSSTYETLSNYMNKEN